MSVLFDCERVRTKFVFNCAKDETHLRQQVERAVPNVASLTYTRNLRRELALNSKMEKLFVTMLLLVIFSSSWRSYAVGKENEKSFLFKMEENLAEENDNGFDDRETRLENHDKGNREFDDTDLENTDDDLYFSQDDGESEKRKR